MLDLTLHSSTADDADVIDPHTLSKKLVSHHVGENPASSVHPLNCCVKPLLALLLFSRVLVAGGSAMAAYLLELSSALHGLFQRSKISALRSHTPNTPIR
jgi:hypothetical protein